MSDLEQVVYIPGVGDKPIEQAELPERLVPFGLAVDLQPIDWSDRDYRQRRLEIVDHVRELREQQGRVSIIGASGGGKAAVDVFARHPDLVHRAVTISTKFKPYNLAPATRELYPNLVISSDALAVSIGGVRGLMPRRMLCVHPEEDEIVNPEDAVLRGAHELVVPVQGHINGIAYALTDGIEPIADFLK